MTTCITHIPCITQVTFKFIDETLLVDNRLLKLMSLKLLLELGAYKHLFVAARRRSIKSVLEKLKPCVSLNQSWTKAFSAKICIVSSKGTSVNSEVTS